MSASMRTQQHMHTAALAGSKASGGAWDGEGMAGGAPPPSPSRLGTRAHWMPLSITGQPASASPRPEQPQRAQVSVPQRGKGKKAEEG
jgi:hypothetical protein